MAVKKKTHSLIFYPITETPNGTTKIVPVPTNGTGVTVLGQLTPMSSDAIFKATGLDLTNGYLFLCDVGDADSCGVNRWAQDEDGNVYMVKSLPKRWNAISVQSFAEVYLEQMEVTV